MLTALFIITMYALIGAYFMRDFTRGLKHHKANFSHLKYGFLPRFTVRLPNGRFKANKVGIFYVANHSQLTLRTYAEMTTITITTPNDTPSFVELLALKMDAVTSLPIDQLDQRQARLVDLLAFIVNHETEDGLLTSQAGNEALESMEYWQSLNSYTKSCGFKRLGNGHFSAAYAHLMLPGKVIKVGFKKDDSGAAYIAFCRMHAGKVGIPVIHDVQRHLGCYTVVLDRLEDIREHRNTQVSDEYTIAESYVGNAAAPTLEDIEGFYGDEQQKEFIWGLAQTAHLIHKFFVGIALFDMHRGNVMVDPRTGHVVITDPVSFTQLPEDNFIVDPDELVREVQEVIKQQMIKRCKNRKAKRDPEGAFWQNIKAARKAHKARKRRRAGADKRAAQQYAVGRECQKVQPVGPHFKAAQIG